MHAFLSLTVALAVAASSSGVQAATRTCDLASLVPLLVDARNDACYASSGIIFPPAKAPTASQWKRTCNVQACSSLYADLLTATPSECAVGSYAVHADLVNQYKTACGLPLDDAASSNGSQDGGPATMSVEDHASDSGSLAPEQVTEEPVVEEAATPEPTTAQVKANSTTVVHALTSSAPSAASPASLVVAVGSTIVALVATHVL